MKLKKQEKGVRMALYAYCVVYGRRKNELLKTPNKRTDGDDDADEDDKNDRRAGSGNDEHFVRE